MSYMGVEFDKVLRKYGHNVYLNRRSQNTDGKPEYSDTFEKHTVRHTTNANRALPTVEKEMMEGILNTSERIYYFRADAHPFDGDRIYETDPRAKTKQVVFNIDQALSLRGLNGEIDYYVVGATRSRPN